MRKFLMLVSLLGLGLSSAPLLAEGDQGEKVAEVTLSGEVVDLTCYLEHGSKGEKHATCAKGCLSGGLPAGFLEDKTGKLYLLIGSDHKPANATVADKAGKAVKVTGSIHEGKGVNLLVLSK